MKILISIFSLILLTPVAHAAKEKETILSNCSAMVFNDLGSSFTALENNKLNLGHLTWMASKKSIPYPKPLDSFRIEVTKHPKHGVLVEKDYSGSRPMHIYVPHSYVSEGKTGNDSFQFKAQWKGVLYRVNCNLKIEKFFD